ncbi:MAG: nitrous oxide reductase accessory protein NosL [Nitrospirota bacterium]
MVSRSLIIALLFSLFLSAGAAFAAEAQKTPVCAQCNMKVTDAEKKASVSLPNVKGMGPSHFCDIGCAVQSRNNECATRQMIFDGNAIVYDFLTGEAVPAEKAFFVFKSSFRTPMGYGVVAFKDKAEAEKFAAEHGKAKVIKWFELVDEKL